MLYVDRAYTFARQTLCRNTSRTNARHYTPPDNGTRNFLVRRTYPNTHTHTSVLVIPFVHRSIFNKNASNQHSIRMRHDNGRRNQFRILCVYRTYCVINVDDLKLNLQAMFQPHFAQTKFHINQEKILISSHKISNCHVINLAMFRFEHETCSELAACRSFYLSIFICLSILILYKTNCG